MQANMQSPANETLIRELLDLMTNDSENLERTMRLLTDDCVWVMEPGGTEYHGASQIKAFVKIAMSGRTHDQDHKVEIVNWFTNNENLCVEYTHSATSTGAFTAGIKAKIKTGASRYCITYHLRDGKIDRVHEYINVASWWLNSLIPIALAYLHRLTKKNLGRETAHTGRTWDIFVVAAFTIIAGLAEVVTGLTHNFFGITTSGVTIFTYSSAAIGIFYAASGFLILTMRKWAAALAFVLLGIDIVGRIVLIATGLYPTDSLKNTLSVIAGTVIVALVALYLGWKWKSLLR